MRRSRAYTAAKCNHCGFVFVLDPECETANHADDGGLVWRFRRRHHQIRRLLLSHLKPGSRVVEIGCGRGELGYLLRNDDFVYIGYEPARGLSDFGRAHDVHIVSGMFDGSAERDADAVILDNVIEHVLDPLKLLSDASASLRPGGMMIVIVPNRADVRAMNGKWREEKLWVPPDHINYFSSADLRRSFASLGMRVRPFGFAALEPRDFRYFPRAAFETIKLPLFGHNVYAVK